MGSQRSTRKYAPLKQYLADVPPEQTTVRLTLPQLEALLGPSRWGTLPAWYLPEVRQSMAQFSAFAVQHQRRPPALVFTRRAGHADESSTA